MAAGRLALAALLAFVAGRCLVPMDETDLYFNLRLGEIVLETGAVPTTNLLSFTHPETPDPNLAWLFQILLALVHRAGGVPATVLLKTAFVLATFAILWVVARRRGAPAGAAAGALALCAWAAEPRFVERPHLVTFLGLATLLLALERAERNRPRLLVALVPLGLLWANANSCFFLAPIVLLLYAAGARIDARSAAAGASPDAVYEKPPPLQAHARGALVVAALLAPLTFVTPSGARWMGYVANHWRMPWLRPLQEYRTAEWPLDGPFFFVAAGIALLLLGSASARLRARVGTLLPLRHALPIVALGILGALRIRFVAELALFAAPALAAGIGRVGRLWSTPRLARFAPAAVASTLMALALVPRLASAGPFVSLGLERGLVPTDAIAFIERHGLAGRMYNDLEVGSYLTWRWWPRHRVFQDPRINGYPDAFHATLRRPDLEPAAWEALLDSFAVDAALITYPDVNPRAALFDPERWALTYRTSEALVFVRRGPARQAFIAAHERPVAFSHSAEGGTSVRFPPRPAASDLRGCEWQRRVGDERHLEGDEGGARRAWSAALSVPGCLDGSAAILARRALGAAQLRAGEPAAALDTLTDVDEPEARTNRAFALLALGRGAEALFAFEGLVATHPSREALLGQALALDATGRRREAVPLLGRLRAERGDDLVGRAAAARLSNWAHP